MTVDMEKLIIENRSDLSMADAIRKALFIVEKGRISRDNTQYAVATIWGSGIVAWSNLNKNSDRIVIENEKK
jgi:hypothetical protein